MQLLFYLALGFAPCLFWLWFLRHKDDLEPEPKHKVLWVFFLGCLSTVPVLQMANWLHSMIPGGEGWYPHFVHSFLLVAAPEELCKILAFLVGIYWHRDLDEPLDGVIYGTAAGLGFASVENVIYLTRTDEASLSLLRGFTAVPMHVATSGAFGFFLGLIKFRPLALAPWLAAAGALIAILFHGGYDFFLFIDEKALSLLGLLPLALVMLSLKIRWARSRSQHYHPRA